MSTAKEYKTETEISREEARKLARSDRQTDKVEPAEKESRRAVVKAWMEDFGF